MAEIDKEKFCYYPFMQMLLQPTGVVSPCCWNQEVTYGIIPQQTLSEVWNSEVAQRLRREFLEGNPTTCSQQMRHIGCHKWSSRDFTHELELTQLQSSGPKRLDVRLNGRCNLECLMCDVWKQPNGVYDRSDFWKIGPTQIFPFLLEMDVLGGEPFVQADTYRLLDEITEVNTKCNWAFVTNGNYKFSEAIRSRLEKIRIRWIQISVDSLDSKIYSQIRKKGDLSRTLSTLDQLLRYRRQRDFEKRGFQVVASICVQKLNWHEIPTFIDFCIERTIQPVLQFLYKPADLSLNTLPRVELKQILAFLESGTEKYGTAILNPIVLPVKETLVYK